MIIKSVSMQENIMNADEHHISYNVMKTLQPLLIIARKFICLFLD